MCDVRQQLRKQHRICATVLFFIKKTDNNMCTVRQAIRQLTDDVQRVLLNADTHMCNLRTNKNTHSIVATVVV